MHELFPQILGEEQPFLAMMQAVAERTDASPSPEPIDNFLTTFSNMVTQKASESSHNCVEEIPTSSVITITQATFY